MAPDTVVDALRLFVAFTGAALVVSVVARRISLPLTVGLVLVGLGAGVVAGPIDREVTHDVVLAVLLPGLVFEAALRTELEELRPSLLGVALLAVPGVILGAAFVAVILAATTGLDPRLGFVVGAMVSATDPAAVIATFRRLQAPRGLATFVEAESLLNDGTGIVLFAIAVGAIGAGTSLADALLSFGVVLVGSVAIGAVAGFVGSRIVSAVDDHLIELTATVVVAYGSYLAAEAVHQSGIIACVVAGLTLGSYGRTHGMSRRTSETVDTVWEFVGFLLTALIFLLVGVAITVGELVAASPTIVWAVVAVVVGRAAIVYLLVGGVASLAHPRGLSRGLPRPWLHVLFWSGLRGAVAVGLALSLPSDFPQRELLVGTTYGVVLFTLLVQGTTSGYLVSRLGLRRDPEATPADP